MIHPTLDRQFANLELYKNSVVFKCGEVNVGGVLGLFEGKHWQNDEYKQETVTINGDSKSDRRISYRPLYYPIDFNDTFSFIEEAYEKLKNGNSHR
jgi:hypothetical protein